MKILLLLMVITFFVVTIVMAVFFRDRRARGRLLFLRNVGWAYVAIIVGLAAWRLFSDGV